MDFDSSTKFISSLAKFLQSLCNGYVEFDNGVEVIGHIYLNVDTGKKIDYVLNEKVCKTDENSVTFISNSFHAQPAEKPKPPPKAAKATEQPPKASNATEHCPRATKATEQSPRATKATEQSPRATKATEQDKPSDPGGSHSQQDDEILILDEPDNKGFEICFESDNLHQQNLSSSKVHPPSASKRSYHQSFQHKSRSSVSAKQSRTEPPSVQNPNNGAHDLDSLHSDRSNSSSNFILSQALATEPNLTAASEADISHLSQVFPQTLNDSTNNQTSGGTDIKQEPGSDVNSYDVNVKQEYDTSAQGDEEQETYDDQDPSTYGGIYDDQFYSGGNRSQSQRHTGYSQISGPGEYYQDAPGPSGEAGGDSTGKRRKKPFKCPVPQCQNCQFRDREKFKRHWREKHEKIIVAYPCNVCSGSYSRRETLLRHARQKHLFVTEAKIWAEHVQPVYQENRLFIDPAPFALETVLESPIDFKLESDT